MLNRLQLSPRFQVLYGFRSESPFVPLTAFPVFKLTVRSENRENSINTCLADPVTHIHATGLPRRRMIKSFKELSGLLSLTW